MFWSRKAMSESNAGFLSIFNNNHIVMLLVDPEFGQIVYANPAAVKFYGYSHEEICSMTIAQINAMSEGQLKCNLAKAQELKECHFILQHRLADGKIRDIEAFCGPIVLDNRQLLYSINFDITDRLRMESEVVRKAVEKIESQSKIAHLNRVLRCVCEVNRLIARSGDSVSLAHSICRILAETRGFSGAILILTDEQGNPVESVCSGMYVNFPDFLEGIKAGNLPECCVEAMQTHGVVIIKDRQRLCHDCPISKECKGLTSLVSAMKYNDELFGFMGVCVADELLDAEEEPGLFAGLAEDVALALHNLMMRSAKKLAEIDRDSLHSQLIQAQKIEAIGQLAGGVAHDFNNLLSVILGYGEILMQDISSESAHFEPMSEIYAAAERAKNLTRQLLAFSRKQVFELKFVQVNQIVMGFEKFLRRIVGEQIRIELNLCDTEAIVKADVSQIEQALMNLAINARDAMPDGGVLTIETSLHYFDEAYASERIGLSPGNYAMLAISDTGVGIDKETMEHMFEPFYTTKGVEKGTGLGLSTAFGIVKQHNGQIWAYSELGKGSVFKVFLPLSAGMEEPVKIETVKDSDGTFSHATIMVVEDDLLVRRLACKILVRQGYRVIEAENFDTAVDLAASFAGKIDLLLSDVIMPGKEGPEVFKAISKMCPDIKVLYMSGYSPSQIGHICKLDANEAFVQKPISVSALLGKVSQLLRGKKKS